MWLGKKTKQKLIMKNIIFNKLDIKQHTIFENI